MIDTNKDMKKGKLVRVITQLVMQNLINVSKGQKVPATHLRGKTILV